MFINFWNFFQGLWSYYELKRIKFYYILGGYVYFFSQIFKRLSLFKGLRLFQTLEWVDLSRINQINHLEHQLVKKQPGQNFGFIELPAPTYILSVTPLYTLLGYKRKQIRNYLDENPNAKVPQIHLGKDVNNKCSFQNTTTQK